MKTKVLLICSECLSRNYVTKIDLSKNNVETFNKYCPKCKKHTIHKVSK
ncbi:MAG: 50S ribosomal protein L33 [Coprobacillus sp.]|nr:50S ribosomal protein L33 [Coprobacillus sp.]